MCVCVCVCVCVYVCVCVSFNHTDYLLVKMSFKYIGIGGDNDS